MNHEKILNWKVQQFISFEEIAILRNSLFPKRESILRFQGTGKRRISFFHLSSQMYENAQRLGINVILKKQAARCVRLLY